MFVAQTMISVPKNHAAVYSTLKGWYWMRQNYQRNEMEQRKAIK